MTLPVGLGAVLSVGVFAWIAGRGLPGGNSLFFCFAKRKVSKRKGDPKSGSPALRYGATCAARLRRGQKQLASLKHVFALIRLRLRCSAQPHGEVRNTKTEDKGDKYKTRTRHGVSLRVQVFGFLSSAVWYSGIRVPLCMRRGAEVQTEKGKNVSERSELFLTPSGPSTTGCP